MLESQKLTIDLSKARETRDTLTATINKAVSAGDDPKADDLTALDQANEKIQGLEIRYRSAVTQEDEETRESGMTRLDHAASHFTPQGLSFLDKKSLATANSPILACSSFTCASSISGCRRPPRANTPGAPSSSARFHW